MEALVVISQQRNHHHHYSGGWSKTPSSAAQFSSPPCSRGFRSINCRSFHSGISIGLLPSPPPPPARTYSSPEPKSLSPQQHPRRGSKRSRSISISSSMSPPSRPELWAGPAFSNSPPPSSLPMPKFPLRQNRSVSLELPRVDRSEDVEVRSHAKSAPSSPTGGSGFGFFNDSDTALATENLRRILHLDISDC